jgi:hypothetical protein
MALLQAPVVSIGAPLEWKLDSPPPLPPLFSTKQEASPQRKPGSLKWELQAANQNTRKPRKTGGLVWELDTWDQIANKPRRTGSLVWLPDSSQPSPEDQLASQPTSPQTSASPSAASVTKPFKVMALSRGITVNRVLYPDVSLTIPNGFKRDPQHFFSVAIDGAERIRKFASNCNRSDCSDAELNAELALLQSGPVSLELLYNLASVSNRNGGLTGQSFGFRFAGNVTDNVGIAIGGESLVSLDSNTCVDVTSNCGQLKGKTLYAVASAAFPLSNNPNPPVLTFTGGAGSGYYGFNGTASTSQWGPIASVAYAFNERISIGVEYSGYAISSGISFIPVKSFPLTASIYATDFLGNVPNNIDESCYNQSCSARVLGRLTFSF